LAHVHLSLLQQVGYPERRLPTELVCGPGDGNIIVPAVTVAVPKTAAKKISTMSTGTFVVIIVCGRKLPASSSHTVTSGRLCTVEVSHG